MELYFKQQIESLNKLFGRKNFRFACFTIVMVLLIQCLQCTNIFAIEPNQEIYTDFYLFENEEVNLINFNSLKDNVERDTLEKYYKTPEGNCEKLILGTHKLYLPWLDNYERGNSGKVEIKRVDGVLKIYGSEIEYAEGFKNYLIMEGTVKPVNEFEFVFHGKITIKIGFISRKEECVREGSYIFKREKNEKFFRMIEEKDPCDKFKDLLDIYI